jgi:hypothetical protein
MNGQLPRFNHGRWRLELITALGTSNLLRSLCSDEEAVRAHLLGVGRPFRVEADGTKKGLADPQAEQWLEPTFREIESAIEVYKRQLMVVTVSITEAAIAQAFEVLFSHKPKVMKGIETNELRLSVSLEEVAEATNLAGLQANLVERAVGFATQGSKPTVLKRLERLFVGKISPLVTDKYLALVALRNVIVHENWSGELSGAEVHDHFETGMDLVKELGHLIIARDLPIEGPSLTFCEAGPSEP